jgi:hypothetical protein
MRGWVGASVGLVVAALWSVPGGAHTASAGGTPPRPLGVVENTLGHFDRDTLTPVGPTIDVAEPHTGPALSPSGDRFAIGVSSPGSPGLPGTGRVGLWLVDPQAMTVAREVRTGIAAEAVAYPGVVAALLQSGSLVVVDPRSGAIRSHRDIGYALCASQSVEAAGRGVFLGRMRRGRAQVAVVEPGGRVRVLRVKLRAGGRCAHVALVSGGGRAYIVGRDSVVALDPRTRHAVSHGIAAPGGRVSAASVPGGLAVAGRHGLRLLDTATWKVRWRDRTARSVLAARGLVIATGTDVRARDARTGHVRWRAPGHAEAIAAGRVYAPPSVLDLRNGARRGTHPAGTTDLRLVTRAG